jgi:hypothetical protein
MIINPSRLSLSSRLRLQQSTKQQHENIMTESVINTTYAGLTLLTISITCTEICVVFIDDGDEDGEDDGDEDGEGVGDIVGESYTQNWSLFT